MFWRQLPATGQLRTVFWTSFNLLTKVANFKKIDSCAECFDANFKKQDSCARSLGQVLAIEQKSPIWSKTTVVQSVLTLISSNKTVAHFVLHKVWLFNKSRQSQATGQLRTVFLRRFSFLTKVANFKKNDSCGECFDRNFKQQDSCARCLGQVLAC